MAKKDLPLGWINRKRYYALQFGSWGILLGGFVLVFGYNFLIEELGTGTFILWLVIVVIINSIFKSSIVNKEKMETNKPMMELIRNIEGNVALEEVNKLLSRDDLSNAMRQKYTIEKIYTLLYLGREAEAKVLLEQTERPVGGNDLYVYLELMFELSDNPRNLLNIEFEMLDNVQDHQTRSTLDGILNYRKLILEAEETGKPSQDLREMINTQRDIFTMLMNQYRIIKIYRNRSRHLTREACEKIMSLLASISFLSALAKRDIQFQKIKMQFF